MSLSIDGSADAVVHGFKEGEPCRQCGEVLRSQLSILNEPDTNPFEVSDSDVEDAADPHLWIDSDQEGDNDQGTWIAIFSTFVKLAVDRYNLRLRFGIYKLEFLISIVGSRSVVSQLFG